MAIAHVASGGGPVRSWSGYVADRSLVDACTVPGTRVRLAVRRGPVAVVLLYLASRFDAEVEDIDTAGSFYEDPSPGVPGGGPSLVDDDWSFADRNVRGSSTQVSRHALGIAIDLNATQHPLGARGTFTGAQVARIRGILADLHDPDTGRCVVRWGGDYESRADEMHFEIDAPMDSVKRVAKAIEAKGDDVSTQDVVKVLTGEKLIRNLNAEIPADRVHPAWTVVQALEQNDSKNDSQGQRLVKLQAQVTALTAAVKALTAAVEGVGPDAVREAIRDGAAELQDQLESLTIRVDGGA